MDKFFYPESMAVIGISIGRITLGNIILMNNVNLGYRGRLYGVGKEAGELQGVPVFTSVDELPETPDVAIIITPAKTVPGFLRDCARKGVRHVVIESGGFSEFSTAHSTLEDEVRAIIAEHGIRLVGPNCVGAANKEINMMMAFGFFKNEGPPSGVAAITQSGGIGNTLIRIVSDNNIHFGKFISIGNKLDLDESDFIEYFLRDEKTDMILMYLEGFKRGRFFFELAMRSDKPFVVLKSNRSELSAKIAQSHTTAISASDDVVDAAFAQAAVTRVEGEDELTVAAKAFQLPVMRGRRVAVLSRSGGHAVITADACAKYEFDMVQFPASYIENLKTIYTTRVIAHQNPLDLGEIFDYTIFIKILEETLKLDGIDGIIFNHLFQSGYESESSRTFLTAVKDLVAQYKKPVAVSIMTNAEELLDINKNHPFPVFASPLQAAAALSMSLAYHERKAARDARGTAPSFPVDAAAIEAIRDRAAGEKRIPLTDEAHAVCAAGGIASPALRRIADENGARGIDLRFPVVLKLLSRDASHKSDVGGVRLGIESADALAAAVSEMRSAVSGAPTPVAIDGFLAQEMAPRGEEFFVGARRDPVFGPIVVAGYGGIFIELFRDRAIRVAPLTASEARDMVRSLKTYPLITGLRGRAALDEDAFVELICRVSNLVTRVESIAEIDLNPVILHERGKGLSVVDARVFFA